MDLVKYIEKTPLLDHHCHFLIDGSITTRKKRTVQVSSEADSSYYSLADTKARLAWWQFQAEAKHFKKDFDPLKQLSAKQYKQYVAKLFKHYNYKTLLLDTGFVPKDAIVNLNETKKLTQTNVYPIYRLETNAQEIMQKTSNFEEWWQQLKASVAKAKKLGYVGFKSIAAYRFGLKITNVSKAEAKDAFLAWKNSGDRKSVV